jgi:hypothetical protein
VTAVADDLVLRRLLAERSLLTQKVERAAAVVARNWLVQHQLASVRVDDENVHPSYALDYNDDTLDAAVTNLPVRLFNRPPAPMWNPILRLANLSKYLNGSDL